MERYYVQKGNKALAWVLVATGGLLTILGLVLLIRHWIYQRQSDISLTSMLLYIFQGTCFWVLGYMNLRSSRYYMEWNETEIRYFLRGHKEVEVIQIGEVENVEIRLYEIRLKVAGREKIIDLEQVQFEEIRKVKEKFEKIQA